MIRDYLKSPSSFLYGLMIATDKFWPDKKYLEIVHRIRTGYKPNFSPEEWDLKMGEPFNESTDSNDND